MGLIPYLLDTHTALWWWTEPAVLSSRARDTIMEQRDAMFVSVASVWEIATKTQSGKLTMIENFVEDYPALMAANRFRPLGVTDMHALKAGFLPHPHRDPFDRLIAAQALLDGMVVITRDRLLGQLGCETLW